ncbi:hypothetical protein VTL71DRAFT_7273 [Oculimacula yallundae]|uniref:Uncharacterized protein n=1 Tax=Oculimacula yallundae TaxID=86028 RepID=A0ABR4BW91_9HELO
MWTRGICTAKTRQLPKHQDQDREEALERRGEEEQERTRWSQSVGSRRLPGPVTLQRKPGVSKPFLVQSARFGTRTWFDKLPSGSSSTPSPPLAIHRDVLYDYAPAFHHQIP